MLLPRHRWQRGLQFRAGQFAWIRIRGTGQRWDEHPFTIASGLHLPRGLEFTIRHVGNFTQAVAALRIGQRVGVDGPYGSFTPDLRPVSRLLLIAGGVGITPGRCSAGRSRRSTTSGYPQNASTPNSSTWSEPLTRPDR